MSQEPRSPQGNPRAVEAKYIANRITSGNSVVVQTQSGREQLKPRFDLIRHHPAGFDWGRTGSGPAQLALALLAHASGSDEFALRHHQVFQHEIVARLERNGWQLTSEQVLQMARFVCHETQLQPQRLQAQTARGLKTVTLRVVLPHTADVGPVIAHGSAPSTGGAIERAIRNLLRDVRLRRRSIRNLQMELSVFNARNGNGCIVP